MSLSILYTYVFLGNAISVDMVAACTILLIRQINHKGGSKLRPGYGSFTMIGFAGTCQRNAPRNCQKAGPGPNVRPRLLGGRKDKERNG